MVFSHGSTAVDTLVPSIRRLQRTVYNWSQLSDYTPKHCWELPATSTSTSQSSEAEGEPGTHNLSICNAVGRICQGDDVERCPGHPWVNFSYHMRVTQWQEEVDDNTAMMDVAAVVNDLPNQPPASQQHPADHSTQVSGKSGDVVLAAPSGALRHRRRRARQLNQYGRRASGSSDGKAGSDSAIDYT